MTIIHRPRICEFMQAYDSDQRQWLQDILDRNNLTPTELARRAGLDPSTLTRFLGGEREGHMLSARTVRKIEQTVATAPAPSPGMQEEASPYLLEQQAPSAFRAAVAAIKAGRNGTDPWVINGDELEGLHLFRGDVIMVDLNADPQAGDIVCVQIYDWNASRARTVFRLYEPPYLLSGNMSGPARKPEVLDGRNVMVRGVVVARLSPREMLRLH